MLNFLDDKKLWWFAGEDPYVLGNCSKSLRKRFGAIGLFVVIVCLISSISITYAVDQILESIFFDIVIGLYFAAFVFILYMFLLYTLSRNVLPTKDNGIVGKIISYFIRISFLVFLGYFVSQPIILNFLKPQVEYELELFKVEEIQNFNNELNLTYAKSLQERRKELSSSTEFQNEIRNNGRLKNREIRSFIKTLNSKNLFIQKIILMNTKGYVKYSSWLLSLIFVFIFILPALMKTLVSFSSNYYKIKKIIQTDLIENHYARFVYSYNKILAKKYNHLNLSIKTKYLNPPYNTELKKPFHNKNKTEFLKWLLDESN